MTSPTQVFDPLLAFDPLPHSRVYLPLGFPVEITTNDAALLNIIEGSWPSAINPGSPVARLRIGVTPSESTLCPPHPLPRGQEHLFSLTADAGNFIVCDLRSAFAFGWFTTNTLAHPSFLRYCFVESAILTMLSTHLVVPLHAACVSIHGRGLLLAGNSGAGKSTLAYACARSGFSYTSDDCSYLLHNDRLRVIGNSRKVRFRPSARQLFPELEGRALTPRLEGKPSIEVPSEELPDITQKPETDIHAVILLDRRETEGATLTPIDSSTGIAHLETALFPLPFIREIQQPVLQRLSRLPFFTMTYQHLSPAMEALDDLTTELQ